MKLIILALLFTSCAGLKDKFVASEIDKKPLMVAWSKNLEPSYETGNLPISLTSPLIHDDVLYVGSGKGSLNAYNVATGRLLWSHQIKGRMTSSPVVYENLLVFGDNTGRVYARDLEKEEMVYEFDLDSGIDSTPTVSAGRLLLHTRNHKVFAADVYSGRVLWSYKRSVPYYSTVQRTSSPLVVKNKVYVGFADGYLVSFTLEEGQVLWERRMTQGQKFVDVDMKPLLVKDKLLVGSVDDKMEVVNLKSGVLHKRLNFRTNRVGIRHENKLVFGSVDGEVVVLDDSFNEIRRVKVSNDAISSVKKWKGGLVISTVGKTLYYVDKKLVVTQKFDLGSAYSAVFGELATGDDYLSMLSSRFRLYTFH